MGVYPLIPDIAPLILIDSFLQALNLSSVHRICRVLSSFFFA